MSMTPMNNFDYLERVKFSEELAEIEAAKKASGMTYEQISELADDSSANADNKSDDNSDDDVANGQTSFFDEKPNPYALKI